MQNIHLIFGELAFIQAAGEYGGIILIAFMGRKSQIIYSRAENYMTTKPIGNFLGGLESLVR